MEKSDMQGTISQLLHTWPSGAWGPKCLSYLLTYLLNPGNVTTLLAVILFFSDSTPPQFLPHA